MTCSGPIRPTWDALSYLVAGFRRQRLALVTTHRDEESPVSDLFQHWLGNVRRLPASTDLTLTRLDEDAPRTRSPCCWADRNHAWWSRFSRSAGQSVLQRDAVRRGDLDSADLPDDLPDGCSQALLDTWQRSSSQRPRDAPDPGSRRPPRRVENPGRSGLGAAEALGVEVVGPRGQRRRRRRDRARGCLVPAPAAGRSAGHALPGEAAPVHAAWAAHLERLPREGVEELRRLGDLASTARKPGTSPRRLLAACRSRRGASRASRGRRPAGRAADLWGADATDTVGRARLLERAGIACWRVGGPGRAIGCSARHLTWSRRGVTRCGRQADAVSARVGAREHQRSNPSDGAPGRRAHRRRSGQRRARRSPGQPRVLSPRPATGPTAARPASAAWSRPNSSASPQPSARRGTRPHVRHRGAGRCRRVCDGASATPQTNDLELPRRRLHLAG